VWSVANQNVNRGYDIATMKINKEEIGVFDSYKDQDKNK
jgi:hypothetical protein